jgi:hypothetical protein
MNMKRVLAKRLSILVLASLVLFGFGICAHAADISGTVADSSGTAITGLTDQIQVTAWQGDPCGWRQWITSDLIDASGNYIISGLSAGDYYLQTDNMSQSDYVNEWWTGGGDPSSYDCNDAVSITVSGSNVTGKDFWLDLGGSVSGQVYESDGTTPISGVWMQAFTGGQCNQQNQVAWANTDAGGAFTLRGIPSGGGYIQACATCQSMNYINEWWDSGGGTMDCNSATLVTSGALGDFTLDAGGTISGQVLDNNGDPEADVWVNFGNDAIEYWTSVNTDPSGQFQLVGLPGGAFEMTIEPEVNTGFAWSMKYDYLNSGEDKVVGTIKLQKGALVTGHINYAGAPLPFVEFWYGGRFELGWGQLDTNGYFEARLPVGSYALSIDEEDGYAMVAAEFEVTDENASYDLDNLPVPGRPARLAYDSLNGEQITGTVTGMGTVHNGEFGVIVFLNDQEFTPDKAGGIGLLGVGIPTPDYTMFVPPTSDYDRDGRNVTVALSLFTDGPDDTESITIVDVVQDQGTPASGVDLSYSSAGQTIDGYVKDHATNEGIYFANVILYRQESGDVFAGLAETDHTGHFVLYNVPPGTYRIASTAQDYPSTTKWSSNFDVVSADVAVPDIFMGAHAGLAALPGIFYLLLGN